MNGSDATSNRNKNRAKFLQARWENLALFTYAVSPELLEKYLPPGLIADTRDGNAFVSLVAFDFLDTKVLGVRWPGFVNFPEINLRFYVRQGNERGVVFIKELVPQRFVAMMARLTYNEPYSSHPMKSKIAREDGAIFIEHQMQYHDNKYHIKLVAEDKPFLPAESSTEHFFKEHKWGFGTSHSKKLLRYEVEHPFWECFPIKSFELNWDFAQIYGNDFAFLNKAKPYSVVFARGSAVAVYPLDNILRPFI